MRGSTTNNADLIGRQYTVKAADHKGHIATITARSFRWPETDMDVRCECGTTWSSGVDILRERLANETP